MSVCNLTMYLADTLRDRETSLHSFNNTIGTSFDEPAVICTGLTYQLVIHHGNFSHFIRLSGATARRGPGPPCLDVPRSHAATHDSR